MNYEIGWDVSRSFIEFVFNIETVLSFEDYI